MQLRDMLSSEDFKKLKSVKSTEKKFDKRKSTKAKSKAKVSGEVKGNDKTPKHSKSNNKVSFKENEQYRTFAKKKIIKECSYCGGGDLEVTANHYYYCNDCGVKVEKR